MALELGILILIGAIILYLILLIFAIFDAIRDRNWVWLIVVLLLQPIGMILYWIFGNIPSGQQRARNDKRMQYISRRKSFNPFRMILSYLFGLIGGIIVLVNTTVPTVCSISFTSNCFSYYLPVLMGFLVGFIIGWIVSSIWRFTRN
ncbi:MAG: PLDc N-terminal domain-containing protein [Nanoarchaeota archaeon]|nr:PLDc N-terminal domain-containing protein [Nanoarchaeota archaeon]